MSVICEVYQSHELGWRVQGCEPKWNQHEQKTVLHSMHLYPDLDYTGAYGTSTYVKYGGADRLRKLLLAIHEVICKKVNAESGKKDKEASAEVKEAAALPPSTTGQNLPAVQPKFGSPATTPTYGVPATTPSYDVPATTPPYDVAKYVNKEADPEQKALPAPTAEEEKPEEEKKEEEKEEKTGDCCDYFIKITTTNLRMIEQGGGGKSFSFRYLMSENLLKDLNGEKISNLDKFKITITPASNTFSKLFAASFEMKLDEFNSKDPEYPGNLVVAIVPTLELEFSGSESLPAKESPKGYDEVSARILKKRILAIEFDPANQSLTPEQREDLFKTTITKWEEDTRKDVDTANTDIDKPKTAQAAPPPQTSTQATDNKQPSTTATQS